MILDRSKETTRRARKILWVAPAGLVLLTAFGCGPIKRDPANVFPGTEVYEKRTSKLKITPDQAYAIALEQAKADNRLQFVSRRPTAIVKRWYIFSLPQGSGASLQGYHVNGDTGEVKYHNDRKSVEPSRG